MSDFLGALMSRRLGTLPFLFWGQLVGVVLAGGWVAVSAPPVPPVMTFAVAAGAGLSVAVGLGALFQAMVIGAITVVAPISAIGVVVPVIVGITHGEHPNVAQVIGIIVTIVGVLAARAPGKQPHARTESALGLALLSALGLGLWLWLIAPASRHGVAWTLLITKAITFLMLSAIVATQRAAPTPARRWTTGSIVDPALRWRTGSTIAVAGLLAFLGAMLYAFATLHGQLAIVSVLGSLYPAVTVLLAYCVLAERLRNVQQIGVALVLIGVVLLSA